MADESLAAKRARLSADAEKASELEKLLFGSAEDAVPAAPAQGSLSGDESADEGLGAFASALGADDDDEVAAESAEEEEGGSGGAGGVESNPLAFLRQADAEGAEVSVPAPRRASGGAAWHDPADELVAARIGQGSHNCLRKLRREEDEQVAGGSDLVARLRAQHRALHGEEASWAGKLRAKADRAKVAAGLEAAREARQDAKRRRRSAEGSAEEEEAEEEAAGGVDADDLSGSLASPLDALLASGEVLTAFGSRSSRLPRGTLELSRLRDANEASRPDAAIKRLGWHPSGRLLMTAGLDRRLRFFAVDGGKRSPLVQSVFLQDLPVHDAAFVAGGAKVLASGRRRHVYLLDLERAAVDRVPGLGPDHPERSLEGFASHPDSDLVAFHGNEGSIPLFSLKARLPAGELQMSGGHRASAFLPDGNQLLTTGADGVLHAWDLRTRRCLGRARDDGAVVGTALATAPAADAAGGALVAAGSDSGAVNVYKYGDLIGARAWRDNASGADAGIWGGDAVGAGVSAWEDDAAASGAARRAPFGAPAGVRAPSPVSSLLNLTTRVDSLAFSPSGEILAMASAHKRDSMKLVHVASGTVFSNWPSSKTPLGHVQDVAFSPSGAFLAIGNAKGRALLYRLHHYAPVAL